MCRFKRRQSGLGNGTMWVQFTRLTRRGRSTHCNGAFPDCGFGEIYCPTLCNTEIVYVCVCAQPYMCVCVIVLSFNPLHHAESWKLLRDIRKQWPCKTMQTRCLGSFPCSRVQQLAKLMLPPPSPFPAPT